MRVADFFCGGGGFSEGFRQAGFDLVFAVDKWQPAVTTYKANKPQCNVIQDDVVRIANLPDEEFEEVVPDTEIIIGSPPCVAFSGSNKSGKGDKTLGLMLLNAYLKIIYRKKYKEHSILKYWILENVPNVKKYIEDQYVAQDFGLTGNHVLQPKQRPSGIYNAKYFGAPTNRKRFICGEFIEPQQTNDDNNLRRLADVLAALGEPKSRLHNALIQDPNYPTLIMPVDQVSDHQYISKVAEFEWKTAQRLKQDKGYMGRMAFPENEGNPARTVMATLSASSRESMILRNDGIRDGYRLPTVREAACMMSFPIDYRFYGKTRSVKHKLAGNAVPPKLSYALARAIALHEGMEIPDDYIRIEHDPKEKFIDWNYKEIPINIEKPKRITSKFKYHIPYLIIKTYRVELTNYHSDFENKAFTWDIEIHRSQGIKNAKIYTPKIDFRILPESLKLNVKNFIKEEKKKISSPNKFQKIFCMTEAQRRADNLKGPYELLNDVKQFIDDNIPANDQGTIIGINENPFELPEAIVIGYYILHKII